MKLIICLLLSSILNISIARDLNQNETQLLKAATLVKQEHSQYLSRLVTDEYPVSKYLSFLILKNGCEPFDELVEEIRLNVYESKDMTKELTSNLDTCKRATVSLKDFEESDT